jgi:hypothetical protein
VEEHDQDDRDTPQAVERGQMAQAEYGRSGWHSGGETEV